MYSYITDVKNINGTQVYTGLVFEIMKAICSTCNYRYDLPLALDLYFMTAVKNKPKH